MTDQPSVPLNEIPQFEFSGEGVSFDTDHCDHGAVADGSPDADAQSTLVNGHGEDHLLPPHAMLPITFNEHMIEVEADSVVLGMEQQRSATSVAAANPDYEGPPYAEVLEHSSRVHMKLRKELAALRSDTAAYMRKVREIAKDLYHVNSASMVPTNYKMSKGIKHGWRTEGVVLAPNVVAGLDDVCPYRSPLCTANCLHMSGHTELAGADGYIVDCRRRRTLMLLHLREAFMARVAGLMAKRAADTPGKYAARLNVLSDLSWESIRYFEPSIGADTTIPEFLRDSVMFYDYTKNCARYQDWLGGSGTANYHLTFSMSEINALYAFYALAQGGSVTVVFDALPEHTGGDAHVRYPADPLPPTFCGYPVVDGDDTDLRFEDRERFGVPVGSGFVVGLRLKGSKHRREYKQNKEEFAGFIFDAKREYDAGDLIRASERRRVVALRARQHREDLPGKFKQKFVGVPNSLVAEARRALGV